MPIVAFGSLEWSRQHGWSLAGSQQDSTLLSNLIWDAFRLHSHCSGLDSTYQKLWQTTNTKIMIIKIEIWGRRILSPKGAILGPWENISSIPPFKNGPAPLFFTILFFFLLLFLFVFELFPSSIIMSHAIKEIKGEGGPLVCVFFKNTFFFTYGPQGLKFLFFIFVLSLWKL